MQGQAAAHQWSACRVMCACTGSGILAAAAGHVWAGMAVELEVHVQPPNMFAIVAQPGDPVCRAHKHSSMSASACSSNLRSWRGGSHGAISASVRDAPPTRGMEHARRMHQPCRLPGHAELRARHEQRRAWSRMHCAARLLVRAFPRACLTCTMCVHRGTAPCPAMPKP